MYYIYIIYIGYIYIYIYRICVYVLYLKQCVCEVLPAKFSYYSWWALLSPWSEIYW